MGSSERVAKLVSGKSTSYTGLETETYTQASILTNIQILHVYEERCSKL
jgi:hypothetical protein